MPVPETIVSTVRRSPSAPRGRRLWRLPGVYRPQSDTWLLVDALARAGLTAGADVLDYCTGSGAVAVAAAQRGAGRVVAVDVSIRATVSVWANARARRLPIEVHRGDLDAARERGPYDVVLANPPYVPARRGEGSTAGSRNWDGGADGRAVIAPLCRAARNLVRPGGFVLVVQSTVAQPDRTLEVLRGAGLSTGVVARERVPFGPVMRRQAESLCAHGLIEAGQDWEELVVIRADRSDN